MQMEGKKKPSKLQLEKVRFRQALCDEMQEKIKQISNNWQEQVTNFTKTKEAIDNRYVSLTLQLDSIYGQVSSKLATVRRQNAALKDKIELQKALKGRLQKRAETDHLEISAEIDMELKLQQRAADLHMQLGESKRRLERQLEKKIQLKKAYLRVINEYKRLKAVEEEREAKRAAQRKKAALLHKKKQMEEEEARRKAEESNPMNRYRALLAAAGHLDYNNKGSTAQNPTTFYQGPMMVPQTAPKEDQIVVDSPQYDEGVWLENNIRTLLSTGNYTDDDPVIRGLRAQLCHLRSLQC